ncbi:hypothetical protein [Streptosporangium sp. V21-05]
MIADKGQNQLAIGLLVDSPSRKGRKPPVIVWVVLVIAAVEVWSGTA